MDLMEKITLLYAILNTTQGMEFKVFVERDSHNIAVAAGKMSAALMAIRALFGDELAILAPPKKGTKK